MKLSQLVQLVNPTYTTLRLTTNNSIRNNNTRKLAVAVASLHTTLAGQIKADEARLVKAMGRDFLIGTRYKVTKRAKVSFFLYMERAEAAFYLVVPSHYETLIREKVSDAWVGVTVQDGAELPEFSETSSRYALGYEKEDALSLRADLRDNDLLASQLNALDVLQDGDRVMIGYNFIPTNQATWRARYRSTMTKIREKQPVDREKTGAAYLLKRALGLSFYVIEAVLEALSGKKPQENDVMSSLADQLAGIKKQELSADTRAKESATIVDMQAIVLSESKDPVRRLNTAKAVAGSFETIAGDNRFSAKRHRGSFDPYAYRWQAPTNTISDKEASNFFALPGRDLLDRFGGIARVDTLETLVPEELQTGTKHIGKNVYKGAETDAYLTTDKDFQYLSLCLVAPTRGGKSTLLENLSIDALKAGESVIVFDYIDTCQLARGIASHFDDDRVLRIDGSCFDTMQGLGFNEVVLTGNPGEDYATIKLQSALFKTLVNALSPDEGKLTPKMGRYLEYASNIVFSQGGSFADVFDCLQYFPHRQRFCEGVPAIYAEDMEESIYGIRELDTEDEGTKLSKIEGIIDRLYTLKSNAYLEKMLKQPTSGNIDLSREIDESQVICIELPDKAFSTDIEKDVMCTYWINKVWLALQTRSNRQPDRYKRVTCNLIIDEIHKIKHTEQFLASKLQEVAKYSLKPIISCHALSQLSGLKRTLREGNSSYMFIAGCDKSNFTEFANELHPFTIDDMLKLPRHHSLNYLKTKAGRATFITKLPPPPSKGDKETCKTRFETDSSGVYCSE